MSFNGIKFESDGSEASVNDTGNVHRFGSSSNFDAAEAAVAKLGGIMDDQSGKWPLLKNGGAFIQGSCSNLTHNFIFFIVSI